MNRIKFLFLGIIVVFTFSCNGQKKNNIQAINGFIVYQYKNQKDLDTLGYRFQLRSSEKNEAPEEWTTEQIVNFEEKIKTLKSLYDLSSREYISFSFDLLMYCKQGVLEERTPKVLRLFAKDTMGISNFISITKTERAIDYLIDNVTPEVHEEIKQLLFKRLANGIPNDITYIAPLLLEEKSDSYYNSLLQLYEKSKNNDFLRTDYYYSILPQVVRLGGKKAIPFIFECFNDELETALRKENVIRHMAILMGLLERYHDLTPEIIKDIEKRMKKSGTMSQFYNFKENPEKVISDKAEINAIIKKAQNSDLLPLEITKGLKRLLTISYCENNYGLEIANFLEIIKVKFDYNASPYSGSSHFLNKSAGYSKIMKKFMEASQADLSTFYQDEYLRYNSNGDSNFALFLGNELEGYVIKLDKNKLLDENHLAIPALFNAVLKQKNSMKQFTVKKDSTTYKSGAKIVRYEKEGSIKMFAASVE